ncbi:MAG: zinc ribbon domain-containing protein [Candidatus Atribacteria bacterium]|nr:zinc ribbon domain-containing protein [Candidatus Atribacteria bacterium]
MKKGKIDMPNYDFKCQDCQETFEVRATIKEMEESKIYCEKCKSKNIKRIFNGFGFCSGKSSSSMNSSSSSCSSCSSGSCSTCG